MTEYLDLKIKVLVENLDGADAVVAKLAQGRREKAPSLSGNGWRVEVTSIERTDGQALGAEGEFEQYWAETHGEGDDEESVAKTEARSAFVYGVKFGRQDP